MAKHEELGATPQGRRSGIRRLLYRPSQDGRKETRPGEGGYSRHGRDWSAIKEQLRRTVSRAPEVVIKVKGSRRSSDDDRDAIAGILRYMMYISRNGRLLTFSEQGERIDGQSAIRELHASWDLDMQRIRSGRGEALHPSFNIIFSMPSKTDPETILEAVQAFARQQFQGHQYVMVLHTQETDPADDPPAHPHVHLVLRAEDEKGQRIYIRKGTLRGWREMLAAELRARGIEANATSRAERGKAFKSVDGAEWHIEKRAKAGKGKPSKARAMRVLTAARDLEQGDVAPKPWEVAMAARRLDVVQKLTQSVVRLRQDGDTKLADDVERFIRDMPALDTEQRAMQRALVKQVQERLQQRDQTADNPLQK
ncbi:hypothetical protein [Herbaspirillum sp. SJZ107]|uniref:relaxase/mobilization nuclease domain-containing protein n=1 Tax=Herbaspirillum sp. SJZ107 TaxID=2572881 RepID=UPI00114D9FD4|nr:hypothetical protein [Herbaspirillum sp. SJZ107]TQK07838.1 hypothetical protein FBX97_3127 [Herbaspirillum sp. SJZ107]